MRFSPHDRGIAGEVGFGRKVHSGDEEPRLEFFDGGDGAFEILVLPESRLNQVVKCLILKQLPPGQIREGFGFDLTVGHPERCRWGKLGTGIVRSHGAGGQQERSYEETEYVHDDSAHFVPYRMKDISGCDRVISSTR